MTHPCTQNESCDSWLAAMPHWQPLFTVPIGIVIGLLIFWCSRRRERKDGGDDRRRTDPLPAVTPETKEQLSRIFSSLLKNGESLLPLADVKRYLMEKHGISGALVDIAFSASENNNNNSFGRSEFIGFVYVLIHAGHVQMVTTECSSEEIVVHDDCSTEEIVVHNECSTKEVEVTAECSSEEVEVIQEVVKMEEDLCNSVETGFQGRDFMKIEGRVKTETSVADAETGEKVMHGPEKDDGPHVDAGRDLEEVSEIWMSESQTVRHFTILPEIESQLLALFSALRREGADDVPLADVKTYLMTKHAMTERKVESIFSTGDADSNGSLDQAEFVKMMFTLTHVHSEIKIDMLTH